MAFLRIGLLSVGFFNAASATPVAPPAPAYTFEGGPPVGTPVTGRPSGWNPVTVPNISGAGEPVLNSFVSFSIEFAFFPDFAGNKNVPNTFSNNLLNNLASFQGSKPNIRVGGNTQDYAIFDAKLKTATKGTYIPSISNDYPLILSFGPSFFESYTTFPNTKFIHGFNLAANTSTASASLVNQIPYACHTLTNSSFHSWEMGNEPDLYKTSAQGIKRPATWNETNYVREWNTKVGKIRDALQKKCGNAWIDKNKFKWLAPSFAGTSNSLDSVKTWEEPLDPKGYVTQYSSHNYISGATSPGVTLAGTLMNHTRTIQSVSAHTREHASLKAAGLNLDYILGETNSLYNQGAPGLSNSFGAALWVLDFSLYCAATSIKQVYMHMGTDYRYASWQPITTNKTDIGTKAPYYGNIAVAAALGDITTNVVRVRNIEMKKETDAAYAVYTSGTLKRVVVINMQQYNYSVPAPLPRPVGSYNFTVPTSCAGSGVVQRLIAQGADAVSGVTFNGVSYAYEVAGGKPKLLGNATKDEVVWVGGDGGFRVDVPDSSAAVVVLRC